MDKKILVLLVLNIVVLSAITGCMTKQEQSAPIINQLPTITSNATPTRGQAPLSVHFQALANDPDGNITSYLWNFGDGSTSNEQNPTHNFSTGGTYIVKVTAYDNKGGNAFNNITISVEDAPKNKAPKSTFNASTNSGDAPLTVLFTFTASDEDGSISSWSLDTNSDGTPEYSNSGTPPASQQVIFPSPGFYTARFTVTDNNGSSVSKTIQVTVNTPPPKPTTLSGFGDSVTSTFQLSEGLAKFTFSYEGDSNFIVWIYNADSGEREDLLVNEIGSYNGLVLEGVSSGFSDLKPGRYTLEVTASGSWDITIEQLQPKSAPSLPQTLTGMGDNLAGPFLVEAGNGAVEFTLHYMGSSNFIVWSYYVNGEREELIANEIGDYDGTKLVSVGGYSGIEAGIHYLSVQATGSWSIEIKYL